MNRRHHFLRCSGVDKILSAVLGFLFFADCICNCKFLILLSCLLCADADCFCAIICLPFVRGVSNKPESARSLEAPLSEPHHPMRTGGLGMGVTHCVRDLRDTSKPRRMQSKRTVSVRKARLRPTRNQVTCPKRRRCCPWLLRMSKAGPKPALSGKQLCRTEARSSTCPSVRLSRLAPDLLRSGSPPCAHLFPAGGRSGAFDTP